MQMVSLTQATYKLGDFPEKKVSQDR